MTTLLLDADIIAFKIASVSQKPHPFCPDEILIDEWDLVVPRIHFEIRKLQTKLETEDVIVCLSCPTAENWRLDVLPTYKGLRDYSKRPVHLSAVKDYMEANWPSYRRPRLEADDIMGILSTSRKGTNIIVSEDKDMKTIPGLLFNPAKDPAPWRVSLEEADRWHMLQTICGDTVDCYAGCPGAGPQKAQEWADGMAWVSHQHKFTRGPRKGQEETRWTTWADGFSTPWERLVTLYHRYGFTEADALVQARVSRILRASDYNFNTREVILWTPDSSRPPVARTA